MRKRLTRRPTGADFSLSSAVVTSHPEPAHPRAPLKIRQMLFNEFYEWFVQAGRICLTMACVSIEMEPVFAGPDRRTERRHCFPCREEGTPRRIAGRNIPAAGNRNEGIGKNKKDKSHPQDITWSQEYRPSRP